MAIVDDIREMLSPLAPKQLELEDDSRRHAGHTGASGGGHFTLRIVAEAFSGLSAVDRHRRVYALLAGLIPSRIHALSISAHTPGECNTLL